MRSQYCFLIASISVALVAGISNAARADECDDAAAGAIKSIDASFVPEIDRYLKLGAAAKEKGINPSQYPVVKPAGDVATVSLTDKAEKLSLQRASAYRQIDLSKADCKKGAIKPSDILKVSELFVSLNLSNSLQGDAKLINSADLLAGTPHAEANALTPASRGNIIRNLGINGSFANIIVDPGTGSAGAGAGAAAAVHDPRVVEFLFGTNRKRGQNASFTGERNPDLTLGAAQVRVPEDHKLGRIELPQSLKIFGITLRSDPVNEKEHFVIRDVSVLNEEKWGEVIREGGDTAIVFVHGFNTSFEDSLYRTAQIVWDLQYKGTTLLFSWPSRGETLDYIYDKESAYGSRDNFIKFLKLITEKYGITKLNLIAHSMGNLLVMDSLASHSRTSDPVRLSELVLAAPDIDRDQFSSMVADVARISSGMTLYASSADKALALSRTLAGGIPRAGDVPPGGPIILPQLDSIDATAMGQEMFGLNHNVFASNRSLIVDIKSILSSGRHPPTDRTPEIHSFPEGATAPSYWRFVP